MSSLNTETIKNFERDKYRLLESSGCNLKFLDKVCQEVGRVNNGKFLDIGCGTGIFAKNLANCSGLRPYGTETSTVAHSIASKRISCSLVSNYNLPFPNNTFDLVLANNVIMMIKDKQSWLLEVSRVLKSRGRFITFMPESYDFREKPLYSYIPGSRKISESAYGNSHSMIQHLKCLGFQSVKVDRLNLGNVCLDEYYIDRHACGYFSNSDIEELDEARSKGLYELRKGVHSMAKVGIKAHYEWERTIIIGVK